MPQDAPPITINKPSQLPGSPMSSVIGFDHPCCFCGYNLRSLALNGHCPECGADVNLAIRGSRMAYQQPGWIRRLRFGSWLVFAGAVGLILLGITSTLTTILSITDSIPFVDDWIFWAMLILLISMSEAVSVGLVMLSWSAPIQVRRKQLRAAITRTSGLCIAITLPIFVILTIQSFNAMQPSTFVMVGGMISWVLIILGVPLLYFFGLAQLSSIASLIPWPKGQRRALTLQIYAPSAFLVWLVAYAIFSLVLTTSFMSSQSSGSAIDWLFMALLPIASLILVLVGATMYAGLCLGLARRINQVAAESAEIRARKSQRDHPEDDAEAEEVFDPGSD